MNAFVRRSNEFTFLTNNKLQLHVVVAGPLVLAKMKLKIGNRGSAKNSKKKKKKRYTAVRKKTSCKAKRECQKVKRNLGTIVVNLI